MCKYVLLVLLLLLVAMMAVAAVVVQEYGWIGFLVLLGALVLFGYAVRKLVPRLFMYLAMRPLRQMGAALRGGRIIVHSVTPCDPPPREEYDPDSCDDPEAIEDDFDAGDESDGEDVGNEGQQQADPFDWYLIEFTVIPPGEASSEGRIVTRRAWAPQMIGAVGPREPLTGTNPFRGWPPPDQFPWNVQNSIAEVWTGAEFEPAGVSVFGERRLRMRVGVTGAVRAVTITYARFTDVGVVALPRIDVSPGGD